MKHCRGFFGCQLDRSKSLRRWRRTTPSSPWSPPDIQMCHLSESTRLPAQHDPSERPTTAQNTCGSGGPVAESLGPRRFTRRIGLVEISVSELRGSRKPSSAETGSIRRGTGIQTEFKSPASRGTRMSVGKGHKCMGAGYVQSRNHGGSGSRYGGSRGRANLGEISVDLARSTTVVWASFGPSFCSNANS